MKASALIGSSSILNIVFRMVRTKAFALIVGPSGIGLLGLYGSILDIARNIATMGLNSSGVRQIAESVGTGDSRRIAQTKIALQRSSFFFGFIGFMLLLILCKPVAQLTFANGVHVAAVALLSIAVFFEAISASQAALIQGMRRIPDLAMLSILGAFFGTVLGIPIVYLFREKGLVPSLLCVSATTLLASWWYARKIKVDKIHLPSREFFREFQLLFKLGFVFMATGLMSMGSAYLIRIIVVRVIGVEAAGFYQAAWTLSGLYSGFILSAMGTDFYPRLTAVANDNTKCNAMVNEQVEVGLLIATPGILATLVLAPIVMTLFYSAKFMPAVEVLRWACLGMILRVAIWPMGYIVMAKGMGLLFFWTELFFALTSVGITYGCILAFGLPGTGIGFFAMYLAYCVAILIIARVISGFRWSAVNLRLSLVFVPLIAIVFACHYVLPHWTAFALGITITACSAAYSFKKLYVLVPYSKFPKAVQNLLRNFRVIR